MRPEESQESQEIQSTEQTYNTVEDMIRSLSEDEQFKKDTLRHLNKRTIIDQLMALRTMRDLSQADIAKKMRCSQPKISKLENGTDEDMSIGDFIKYTGCLGYNVKIMLLRDDIPLVAEVKMHALAIDRVLRRIAEMSAGDDTMTDGAASFCGETMVNMARFVLNTAKSLGKAGEKGLLKYLDAIKPPQVQIEASSDDPPETTPCCDKEPAVA
jgi:transcriptional regulator with XRE-family HTH domain